MSADSSPDIQTRISAIEDFVDSFALKKDAASAMGFSPSQLSKLLNPATATPGRLDSAEGAIALWKLKQAPQAERPDPSLSVSENGGIVPAGYTRVPEILIEPSASEVWDIGSEEDVTPEEQPSDTIYPDWYIRSEYGVSPDRIRFVRVRGDSMLPTIAPGQRLVVALLAPGSTLRDSAIYILVGPGGAQVKRLIQEPDHIHVWSDNPDRPRFKVRLATFSKDYTVVAVVLEANLKL